ncbi:hypothetical protein ABW20_dc0107796 [Dactylellina cionopaga]|nr:hypothetical protein ABW20_dc0107796 [Dactylellina cionopaga]
MSKKSKTVEGDTVEPEKVEKKDKSQKKEKKEKKDKKSKTADEPTAASSAPKSLFAAPTKAVDEGLASLFSISAAPVDIAAAARSKRSARVAGIANKTSDETLDNEEAVDEIPSEVANALAAREDALRQEKKKKRKRTTEPSIEDVYMEKLRDEEPEARKKPRKDEKEADGEGEGEKITGENEVEGEEGDGESEPENESGDESSSQDEEEGEEEPQVRIRHETEGGLQEQEFDKANRTVFVGNLPSTVISEKAEYKALKAALKAHGIVSSVRFRSIAFSDQIPRKAAFITKALHVDQNNVNAYIVFKTVEGARSSLKLNGTVILNHHIRVDSVAHPSKNDSRRCVFVGNLDFEAAEESLWRHFSTCGKVENVRLIRDAKTNVGKGFAYVQFEDDLSVEKALLLNEKPMQVEKGRKRSLRVTRAKNMKRKAVPDSAPGATRAVKRIGTYVPKADPRKSGMVGRAGKLFGRAGGAKMKKMGEVGTFEGTRAVPGMDVGLRTSGSGKKKGKPRGRTTVRSAAWKKTPAPAT